MHALTRHLAIVTFAGALPGVVHAGETCDEWGSILPNDSTVTPGQTVNLRISGASGDCGDVDTCMWWLDEQEGLGSLDSDQGSPVLWTAPADASALEDCVGIAFSVYAQCSDGDTLDSAVITVVCSEEDKLLERAGDPETSVAGGGCQSPQLSEALLVVPLLGAGLMGRRRN